MIQFFALTGLLNFLAAIGLVLYITTKSRKNSIYWIFVLLNVALGVWSFGYWRWLLSADGAAALFWVRVLSIGSTLIPVFFLHWVTLFLKMARRRAVVLVFAYLITAGLLYFSFSGVFVASVRPVGAFPWWPAPGVLYHLYIAVAYIGFIGYALLLLWKRYRTTRGQMRLRIRYIFLGLLIGVLGGFTNFPAWYGIPVSPYGNAVTMLFFFACAYAMVQYRLRDIRHVIASGIVYLTTFMVTIFVAIFLWQWRLFDVQGLYRIGVVTLFAIVLYQLLRQALHRISADILFPGIMRKEQAVMNVANQLPHIIEYQKVIDLIIDTIKDTMQLERAGVLIADRSVKPVAYRIAKTAGFNEQNGISLVRDSVLTQQLEKTQKPLVRDELDFLISGAKTDRELEGFYTLRANMQRIEASLCLPLISNKQLIGIIVLGGKRTGDAYTRDDLELLETLSNQAAIAIENAQLYREVRDFNKNLEQKVTEQTKDIVAKAERIEKMARMRSEFLDIASHQLRTPVSVINGTLSMMMEGDMDDLPEEEQRKFIGNIYHKGLKLKNIIEDILSASEMDTATFTLPNVTRANLGVIAERVVAGKQDEAKRRTLSLVYHKPSQPIPDMWLNETYMEQALTNLVDNAIKYSGAGVIDVGITLENGSVVLKVKDRGIGIPKADLPKLFRKFARAKNAKEMYTDGSGLGLFIVKQVVEAHGGAVTVESVEDEGSAFSITLPTQTKARVAK